MALKIAIRIRCGRASRAAFRGSRGWRETITTPQQPVLIPGNSGTELVADFTQFPADHTPLPGAVVASLLATAKFGFMTMERAGGRWVVKAWDRTAGLVDVVLVVRPENRLHAARRGLAGATPPARCARSRYNPTF